MMVERETQAEEEQSSIDDFDVVEDIMDIFQFQLHQIVIDTLKALP
jgi:hypothetical protein